MSGAPATGSSAAPPASAIGKLTALFPKTPEGRPKFITEPHEFNETMERLAASGLCNLLCSIQYVDYIPPVQAVSLRVIVAREEMYYSPKWCKDGALALKGESLAVLFREAGGSYRRSERMDDGSDPYKCHISATVVMRAMNGLDAPFTKDREVDLRPGSAESTPMTENQLAQARQTILRVAETKAQLRAIRTAIGASQSYDRAHQALPFVIPVLVPNPDMTNPQHAGFMLAHAMGATEVLYGKKALPPATIQTGTDLADVHTGEVIDADVVDPAAVNTAAGGGFAAASVAPAPADLGDLAEPAPGGKCDCPCGCVVPVSEQRAAITVQRRGAVRCAACYPGKDFDPEKHKSLASLGMNPDVTVKQAIAMKAGKTTGER